MRDRGRGLGQGAGAGGEGRVLGCGGMAWGWVGWGVGYILNHIRDSYSVF